ncbi:MAG TPA: hypothetical protein VME42_12685 [Steroidobacteraceae bacterium]|nr:hypothetical protein [Steroidobacteraceae bacterium]
MPATPAWLAAVESVLNRGIGQSIKAGAAAARLESTSLAMHIEGLPPLRAAVCAGKLVLTGGADGAADARISGSVLALLELAGARRERPRGGERLEISGDAEIAAGYRTLFSLARPDGEEELSRIIGDLPARRLSVAARAALSWVRRATRTAAQNVSEYLQEESRDLASRPEIEEFLEAVDVLRETADRVEARLARVEQRLKDAP